MGRLPTMPLIGFSCALKGSCCQQRGPAASMATMTDTTVPKTQTTSPTTPRFSAFFIEVVCTLGTTAPQTVISPPPNGGNGVIRDPTRRRHADSQPLMLQNPHRHRYGGHRRDRRAGPRHRRNRKAGLQGTRAAVPVGGGAWPDNEPTHRSKVAVRMAEAGGTDTTASRISHVIPRSTNRHKLKYRRISRIRIQTPTCAHGNCMRNCWLTAIAGHQGDAPNHTSAH